MTDHVSKRKKDLSYRLKYANPLLSKDIENEDEDDGGGGIFIPYMDDWGTVKPPLTMDDIQQQNKDQYRIASMQADALGAMYETNAEQPREKNVEQQSAEMGLGMGHGGQQHAKAHPLTATSVYFSGDGITVNADAQINEQATEVYNKRLELQHAHKARLQHSSAPKLTL